MLKNITIQNINTNYYDSGEGEKTVLFLHGWAAPVEVYQSIFNFLEGKNVVKTIVVKNKLINLILK